MTARRRPRMRRLVDNTVALVVAGELSADVAAQKLLENGVPVAVIGRVLSDAAAQRAQEASHPDVRPVAPGPAPHAAQGNLMSRPPSIDAPHTGLSMLVPGLAGAAALRHTLFTS